MNDLNAGTVFITGARGYVGAFLLEELLGNTDCHVAVLLRGRDNESAGRSFEDVLRRFGIWREEWRSRIRPVAGDLGEPRFGLGESDFESLAAEVDVIYHCGAWVNFTYPYSALKAANVNGTKEVLRLACRGRRKHVHHLSTVDALHASGADHPLLEVPLTRQPATMPTGYALSKWVAEHVLNEAQNNGVPITIYRPGWVLGHGTSGAAPGNNLLLWALKGFITMGILPENVHTFDVIPVDFTARALFHLSRSDGAEGRIFHLWSPEPGSFAEAYGWVRSFGYDFDVVPVSKAHYLALNGSASDVLHPLIPEIFPYGNEAMLSHLLPQHVGREPGVECRNTDTELAKVGMRREVFTESHMHKMLGYLVRTGFLPAPEAVRADSTVGVA